MKPLILLVLLSGVAACDQSRTRYCLSNTIGVQPLHVDETWYPSLGTLDEAQSSCAVFPDPPTITWVIHPASAVDIGENGALTGRMPGEFRATASNLAGEEFLRLRGFVMPGEYRLDPPVSDRVISVGESYTLPVGAVDADGQPLPGAWLFAAPQDMDVLGQRGCLPRRDSADCILEGREPGQSDVRVSIGKVSETFSISVQ